MNKVAVIGLGYVGMPLALEIHKSKKYQVVGFDIQPKKAPFKTGTKDSILKDSDFIIVCVPTPVKNNKIPDLTPLKSACRTAAKYLKKGQTIIIESTINPGTCEEVLLPLFQKISKLSPGKDFYLAHCPERINPGDKKWTVKNIPRIVGALTKKRATQTANFYKSFLKAPIKIVSSLKIAEASKVIENTFRDINIAYVNELAKSFDKLEIDLPEALAAAATKPFGFLPHFPSCGVGGHCIPVDPYYLIQRAKKSGFTHGFLKKAREVNESMPAYTVKLLKDRLPKLPKNAKVGLLGLSYKPNIPDLRESPSLKILKLLKPYKPEVFDPYFPELSTTKTLTEFLQKVDALVLATSHKEFTKLTAKILKKHGIKIVIDGKNCLNKGSLTAAGITYKGIGH